MLYLGFGVPDLELWNTFWNTLFWEIFMELQTCSVCHEEKHWRRFRKQLGGGVMEETSVCSACRNKIAAATCRKKKQFDEQVARNNVKHQKMLELGVPYYYPEVEKAMRTYCNTKTAMDRKYLRDHQDKPLSTQPHIARVQQSARRHAKGWIGFYDEILNHAINLLRQTGQRPPWSQREGKADLHRMYGVYNTKRAQLLRYRG